jgi:hypothetical protein
MKIVEVTKNADGSMTCRKDDGTTFTIEAEDETLQAFVIFVVTRKGDN